MRERHFLIVVVASVGLAFILGGSVAVAALSNLSYSYPTTATIPQGSLVSLNSKHQVESANISNQTNLLGVAVQANTSLLAAGGGGTEQVAVNGIADVWVSTLGGDIAQGDHIGVSPVNGVGEKASDGARIIGAAQASFTASTKGAVRQTIKLTNGKTKSISMGYIPVTIVIGTENSTVSGALSSAQKFAQNVIGHPVSVLSVVVSGIVAMVALIAVVALIYGSVRGEMISIGRNPLAKQAIFESLAQVMAMAALVVVLAIITIYLTLH